MRSRSPEYRHSKRSSFPEKAPTVPDTPSHPGLEDGAPIADSIERFTHQEPEPFGKGNYPFRIGVSETTPWPQLA
jgi:hypothetical protein